MLRMYQNNNSPFLCVIILNDILRVAYELCPHKKKNIHRHIVTSYAYAVRTTRPNSVHSLSELGDGSEFCPRR